MILIACVPVLPENHEREAPLHQIVDDVLHGRLSVFLVPNINYEQ